VCPRRFAGHRPPLAVSKNVLGTDPPDPVESSTFRGRRSAVPRFINQMFDGTNSGRLPDVAVLSEAIPSRRNK
jgi:hypothetical protein